MNLIRRTPQTALFPRFDTSLLREFENLAETLPRFVTPYLGKETMTVAEWAPLVDIQETEKEYLFKVELPEIDPKKVKVTIQESVLTIEGEREAEKEETNKKLHRIERFYGKFVRTFAVPVDADEVKVAAKFKDGMLYIHLPKAEKARPKTIEVKVAS
jgi:HSP20 family protein